MKPAVVAPPLHGWTVVCLRPSHEQSSARRQIERRGARHVSLPGLRLEALSGGTRALGQALASNALVFTSPAAVRFAAGLVDLAAHAGTPVFAVGSGTRRLLERHGLPAVAPGSGLMHSEGLLALPGWAAVRGAVGLITAPGGRGVIARVLAERGFEVRRANIYRRCPPRLDARHSRALVASNPPRAVLVTSGEALDGVLGALPDDPRARLLDSLAVASSQRLVDQCREAGFSRWLQVPDPGVVAMLDALSRQHADGAFG